MKINYKKVLKLVTLLITSMLIAVVSAQVYSYMYIEGSGTITSQELGWELGTTAPSGSKIEGSYVKLLNLSIPQNNPKNFTDCVRIVNNDNTNDYTFSLEIAEVGGNTTKFTTFDLILYNSTSRYATLDVKTKGSSASNLYIGASQTLYIRFEVTPLTDEADGYIYFTVKLTYQSAS